MLGTILSQDRGYAAGAILRGVVGLTAKAPATMQGKIRLVDDHGAELIDAPYVEALELILDSSAWISWS